MAPQPALMFVPSGALPIACTLGAEPLERLGRELRVGAVRAVDHEPSPVEVGAEALDDVVDVARAGASAGLDLSPCRSAGGASSRLSISSSSASVSFRPPPVKNLTPLYSGGLCDAVMTTPRSSAPSATAPLGRIPPSTAVAPAEAIPTATAAFELDARAAGVAPDEHALGAAPEHRGTPEPLDEIRGQELAGDAPNAVGPEVPARHRAGG